MADVTISYKGNEIASMNATGVKTLLTGSTFCEGDISITYTKPGGGASKKKQINFIDYDGTLLHSYTKTEINAMTSESDLPANPSHTGLTAQGWNWTLAQIKAQLTAAPDGDVWVGQMYVTTSGASEIDITLDDPEHLSPYLTIAVYGSVSVDWGDNSTSSTVTGTSLSSLNYTLHEYASTGDYTIKISVSSGSFTFYNNSSSKSGVLSVYGSDSNRRYDRRYSGSITSIRIGSNVTSIGGSAFSSCYSLQSITIPSSVTSIGSNAFFNCYSLQSITIPSSVTSIGSNAFGSCCSLQNITIPSGVTSIGGSAFSACCSLQNITIPSGVTSIGGSAFFNCCSLQNITIPSNVTSIGSDVFNSCYSLQSITIPSSVTSIGTYAFYGCSSLQSVTIPSNVTSIKNSAFYNCYSLQNITIPSGVTSIENNSFYHCYDILEYHIKPTTPPTLSSTNAFSGIVAGTIIYVPSASLTTYQTTSNWSTYASYMQGE